MPTRVDEVRGWLDRVFSGAAFTLAPASSDASFRSYLRVRRGDEAYIVMDAPPDKEDCRTFQSVAARLALAGLNVPRVHAADPERGLLLLSDLGRDHFFDRLSSENVERLYGDAMEALLAMQTDVPTDGLPDYDRGRLRAEMELFREWFLSVHLGIEPTPAQAEVLTASFTRLCRSALEQPRVFVHRDYHSRNLMVCRQGPGILDFQDALRGPVTYDLVSLLRDVYVRWPRARVEGWALRYRDAAIERGIIPAEGRDRFLGWFDLMGVQRHLKVAGIFARLYHRDGKPRYLEDIPLTVRYLLEICPRYPELAPLADLLGELDLRRRLE